MHMPILAITPPTGRSRTERPLRITGEHGDVFDQDQSIATRWTELVSAQSLKKRQADECEVCTGNELVRVGGLRARSWVWTFHRAGISRSIPHFHLAQKAARTRTGKLHGKRV